MQEEIPRLKEKWFFGEDDTLTTPTRNNKYKLSTREVVKEDDVILIDEDTPKPKIQTAIRDKKAAKPTIADKMEFNKHVRKFIRLQRKVKPAVVETKTVKKYKFGDPESDGNLDEVDE